jgi:hypothetical protein
MTTPIETDSPHMRQVAQMAVPWFTRGLPRSTTFGKQTTTPIDINSPHMNRIAKMAVPWFDRPLTETRFGLQNVEGTNQNRPTSTATAPSPPLGRAQDTF